LSGDQVTKRQIINILDRLSTPSYVLNFIESLKVSSVAEHISKEKIPQISEIRKLENIILPSTVHYSKQQMNFSSFSEGN
jgi:hypothetical protein